MGPPVAASGLPVEPPDREPMAWPISPGQIVGSDLAKLDDAFRHAEVCPRGAIARNRPPIVSVGTRALIIAQPGEPLKVVNEQDGTISRPADQNPRSLLGSVW